jgi:hypothetical protein
MGLPVGGILKVIGNIFGIGKNYLQNRQKLKQVKAEQEFKIVEAETKAIVDRILTNTQSDAEIDIITARNKRFTIKDDVITYLFLVPIFVATFVPFIVAYNNSSWVDLNSHIVESYESLSQLPKWYPYVMGMVVVDVLGFRTFLRKVSEKWINKK